MVKQKLKNLRDSYMKCKRFLKSMTGQAAKKNMKNGLGVVVWGFWTIHSHLGQQPPMFQIDKFQKPHYRKWEPHN
jgi:hypothetical protein